MQRERLGGWCMVGGALLGVLVMALHPTSLDIMHDPRVQTVLNTVVHSLALAGLPISLYGGFVLARRLAGESPVSELALAFYAAAVIATMAAAVASGFLAPGLVVGLGAADAATKTMDMALLGLVSNINQSFAKLFVVGASVAIIVWSTIMVRRRIFGAAGGVGLVVGLLPLAGVLLGHWRLDVHGFGAVVVLQTIWWVMVGSSILKSASRRPKAS
jgi:hypothetical protein